MEDTRHITVLPHEATEGLLINPGSIVVDATGGGGGHSALILERLAGSGTLFVIDSDPEMVRKLTDRLIPNGAALHVVCGNFRNIADIAQDHSLSHVDAILADLGWNSEQFETEGKGFSFQKNEPLLMTYGDPALAPFDARDIVNTWSEESIADALYAYADERFARRIAHEICRARVEKPLETTDDLVACIKKAIPARFQKGRIHPATKTFQALRIAVNDELDVLSDFIDGSLKILVSGGHLAIITFHSIEDRLVKQKYRALEAEEKGTIVTKKPRTASPEELAQNPRARSAKLRIFQKS
ncbi:16S rRNA (cytosine(1402)-N(4))-methyltransferase RsmH [Patescibacteria group bacterium]|nr:16S rRNA (cytosine(1402)-N(4))-methyltransferase RsmH [Patescibacteria group bacterium]